jgi:NADH-quinone oxidoreductase subunit C
VPNTSQIIAIGDTKMINTIIDAQEGPIVYLDVATPQTLLLLLKDSLLFHYNMVLDCWGAHYLEKIGASFQINYLLCNLRTNIRLFLRKGILSDSFGLLYTTSLVNIFPAINWFEREIWDLFGIVFTEHPDLRRILTDYGFNGYPLRKDFPVCGYLELKYNALKGTLLYVPIKMNQEYRYFSFENPWI